jgi:hypothetical protein
MLYYTFTYMPKKYWWDNYIDLFNEVILLKAVCCLLVFSNDVIDESEKIKVGNIFNNWVMVPLLIVNCSWFFIASIFKSLHNRRHNKKK